MLKNFLHNNRGQTALVGVLIIMAIVLLLTLTMSYTSSQELQINTKETANKQVAYLADSCLDEALVRLRRDDTYIGGSLTLFGGTCVINITAQSHNRTINITAQKDDNVRKLEAVLDLENPSRLHSWRELTD